MALTVKTNNGNLYTYLRKTNEIVDGAIVESLSPLVFNKREMKREFSNLSVFTIAVTNKCNLRCTYCCYSGAYRNTRQHGSKSLLLSDIDSIVSFIGDYAKVFPITVSFYGGECLLEYDLLRRIVDSCQREWKDNVQFEISTNGLLLQPDIIQWCVDNKITMFISLDGTSEIQDRQRVTISGKPTFAKVRGALSYIDANHHDYFSEKVQLMMTVTEIKELPSIAKNWYADSLLRNKLPLRISSVYPNYSKGVSKVNEVDCLSTYLRLLDYYVAHPEYTLLKVFFERFLAEWIVRPIFEMANETDCPSCVPYNSKLYIDTDGQIGLCEKIPDVYRFGNIRDGINWNMVVVQKNRIESIISKRCSTCSIARLCDVCPINIDLSDEEMNVFCHNQRVIQEIKLRIMCEMAERRLI